jgi:outer membrane immunogenic protein
MKNGRHLNRIAVGAAIIAGATLGAASAAHADGMERGAQAAAAYVRPFTWTGFYVGANVGYNWGDNNRLRDLDGWVGDFRIGDVDGASFGLQVGYNQQFQRIVVGIEGDAGFFGVTGSGQFPGLTGLGAASTAESFATIDMDYYGTIAGRLGFTVADRVLIYGKAGWGWVRTRASFSDSNGSFTLVSGLERTATLDGGVWGGGVEYALSDWFTLKVEYLRFDISDTLTQTATSATGKSFRFTHDIQDVDTVKVGFNIKFNRDVAPVK